MIIGTWADHPVHLKELVNNRLPSMEWGLPKWVVCSYNRAQDIEFLNKCTDWQQWIEDQNICAYICLVSCAIVFMNDEDVALFRLTWL
jgi:hypothetical protein